MEAVAPNPCLVQLSRYGIAVGEIGMPPVKGGIEAGHLRQVGPQLHQGANWGEIVGLVQGCQRNEALKTRDQVFVNPHRRGKIRSTVDNAVADRHQLNIEGLAQPGGCNARGRRKVGNVLRRIAGVNNRGAACVDSAKPRRGPYPIDLPFGDPLQRGSAINAEQLEFEARRTGVEDQQSVHG